MKKFFVTILIIIILIIAFKNIPVQVHRLFGNYCITRDIAIPQWINNEEYCYIEVEKYFIPIKIWPTPLQMLDFRGDNATFYIYKVNINQPEKKELIRKIDKRVDFFAGPDWHDINRKNFTFRYLDNEKLVLIIRSRYKYIAYYMNTQGKLLKRRVFGWDYLDGGDYSIIDISPDGKKLLMRKYNDLYVRDINTKKESLFYEDALRQRGRAKWIFKNNLIEYKSFPINKEKHYKSFSRQSAEKCEIYILDEKKENIELIYSGIFKNYDGIESLSLDATLSVKDKFLFLSKIGIFQKQDEKWQMVKDLKDMDFNFCYPDWSPDGKHLVGVINNNSLKVIKVKDLLQD